MKLRHVVVTGAGGAIGGALAERFADRWPDAHLSLVDIDVDATSRTAARIGVPRTSSHAWDLSRPETLPGAWAELVSEHGPVDGLVNCAGIMHVESVAGTPWDTGQRVLDIDLVSPLRLLSLATPAMVQARHGVIVNVSSMAGRLPLRGCAYYGGAKAGIAMASEIAHLELAPAGVKVVTVYPGPVTSNLERRARAQVGPSLIARMLPVGEPMEVARATLRALDRGEPRVASPRTYQVANRALGIATWVTRRYSPSPRS